MCWLPGPTSDGRLVVTNSATVPTWQFGAGIIGATNVWAAASVPPYELWTFQTTFRWIFRSATANGRWTDALGDLIQLHRSNLGLGALPRINRQLWTAVVGGSG